MADDTADDLDNSLDEVDEVAALVERISQRAAQAEFPIVQPNELKDAIRTEEASLALQFVSKAEANLYGI